MTRSLTSRRWLHQEQPMQKPWSMSYNARAWAFLQPGSMDASYIQLIRQQYHSRRESLQALQQHEDAWNKFPGQQEDSELSAAGTPPTAWQNDTTAASVLDINARTMVYRQPFMSRTNGDVQLDVLQYNSSRQVQRRQPVVQSIIGHNLSVPSPRS